MEHADDTNPSPQSGEPQANASPQVGELRLGVAASGDLRWAVVDVTGPTEDARRLLDLSPIAAVALGRCMAAASLLFRFTTKTPGRMHFDVRGDGPLGKVLAEINSDGDLRGLVGNGQLATPEDGQLAIGDAVGQGILQVSRDSGERGTYRSQVQLVNGEIGSDLVHFLEQSQQIRSAAVLGVLPRSTGVHAAGGLLVEAFPGVPETVLQKLEANLAALGGEISPLLESQGIDGLLTALFGDFDCEELERYPLRYNCRCSAETLRESLESLTTEQLTQASDDDGKLRAECAFCGIVFVYDSRDLIQSH